jgi:hypothetical protein
MTVLFIRRCTVEVPAIVQKTDLPAVPALEGPHQLIAKPSRHTFSPFLAVITEDNAHENLMQDRLMSSYGEVLG